MVTLTDEQRKVAIEHALKPQYEALEKRRAELETALQGDVDVEAMSDAGREALGLEAALGEEKVRKMADKANEEKIEEGRKLGHHPGPTLSKSVEKPEVKEPAKEPVKETPKPSLKK